MNDERLKRLEEKLAFLEHHVTEQDKVILELGDQMARLRRELKRLQNQSVGGGSTEVERGADDPADERPPHY